MLGPLWGGLNKSGALGKYLILLLFPPGPLCRTKQRLLCMKRVRTITGRQVVKPQTEWEQAATIKLATCACMGHVRVAVTMSRWPEP